MVPIFTGPCFPSGPMSTGAEVPYLLRVRGPELVDRDREEGPILAMWDQFADLGTLDRHVMDTSDEAAATTAVRVADALADGSFRLAS